MFKYLLFFPFLMTFLKSSAGVLARFLIPLSITLLFGVIFLSHFAAQESQLDSFFNMTLRSVLEEDSHAFVEALAGNEGAQTFFTACQNGILSSSECNLSIDNPYLASSFAQSKDDWKKQLSIVFAYADPYVEKKLEYISLGIGAFLLGSLLLWFSLSYDLQLFFRKLTGRLGLEFLFAFLFVLSLLHLGKGDIIPLLQNVLTGAPDIVYSFFSTFLLLFIHALFQPFYYPLLILAFLFLGVWFILWIYPWAATKFGK